ncbi:DUF1786 domain-containing protein [Methanothermobacter sp. KEPCO 2]|uniref:DUF1786 domain-containing protein n=1 Tax=Methanothermobacter sp. KEPCO 2 TaxID=3240977 RepID=UPI003511BF3D
MEGRYDSHMKILAVDVGAGTQDIMYHDTEVDRIENSIKMVMPSPTRIIAERIRGISEDVFIHGQTMGGGPVSRAIMEHLERGYRVVMTPEAARTIRDDLERVRAMGIEISERDPGLRRVKLGDVDLGAIAGALAHFDVELEIDFMGVAVQDHGAGGDMGDRNFRFMKIREKLREPLKPQEFSYLGNVPDHFTRMKSIEDAAEHPILMMDSKFASIAGALLDPEVDSDGPLVAVDVGNGHTLAASILDGRIHGVMEHHTRMMSPEKLEELLLKLAHGEITHREVHGDGGHGAHVLGGVGEPEVVIATGPQRSILDETSLRVHHAAPAGDVMMTGPVGLIGSIEYRVMH